MKSPHAITKRTPARVSAIVAALHTGATRTAAAVRGEIGHATFYRWFEEDAAFRAAVEAAEAEAELRFTKIVAEAANGTWQAAAWWLERRRPADYRRRDGVELTGRDGGPVETRDVDALTDHEKQLLGAAIRHELARRPADAEARGAEPAAREG